MGDQPVPVKPVVVGNVAGEEAAQIQQPFFQKYIQKTPWWATSVAFHGIIFVCLYLVKNVTPTIGPDIVLTTELAPPPEQLKDEPKEIIKNVDVVRDVVTEQDVKPSETVVEDKVFIEDPTAVNEGPMGDPNMLTDYDLGGDGKIGAMGVGGGGMGGLFGNRGNKKGAMARYGGKGTESAVEKGLEWLKRHQNPEGSWGAKSFINQCKEADSQCKKGAGSLADIVDNQNQPGVMQPAVMANMANMMQQTRAAMTAIATLPFLGAGYTHKSGKYKETVSKGLNYVLSCQKDDGSFPKESSHYTGYTTGFCTLVLAEAYGMTKDQKLLPPLEKAVSYLIDVHQCPGSAWRYSPKMEPDTSVTAAIVMALKDAHLCGAKGDYKKAFDGAQAWFDKASCGDYKGLCNYCAMGPVVNVRVNNVNVRPQMTASSTATAIMNLSLQLLGMKRSEARLKEGAEYMLKIGPGWYKEPAQQAQPGNVAVFAGMGQTGSYYTYYATLSMFQYGGKEWKEWNEEMKKQLLSTQVSGGCADGSWITGNGKEKAGYHDHLGSMCGKVWTTAIAVLTLEVYYRYSPLFR